MRPIGLRLDGRSDEGGSCGRDEKCALSLPFREDEEVEERSKDLDEEGSETCRNGAGVSCVAMNASRGVFVLAGGTTGDRETEDIEAD